MPPVCNRCPFAIAVFEEAHRLWPSASTASNGICSGDPAHWNDPTSDHNPSGPNHYAHAIDITHDPAHGADMGKMALAISARMAAGTELRVEYLVFNFGGADMIYHPAAHGHEWVQNGTYKTDHKTHLHTSFHAIPWVENSTAPYFVMNPAVEDIDMTEAELLKHLADFREQIKSDTKAIVEKDMRELLPQILGYTDSQGVYHPGAVDDVMDHQLGGYNEHNVYKPNLLKINLRQANGVGSKP